MQDWDLIKLIRLLTVLTLDSSATLSNPYLNYIKQPINYSFEKHLDFNEKLNTHIIDSSI